jgi:hypothetical protein
VRAAGGEFAPLPDVATAPSEVGELQVAMSATCRSTLVWSAAGLLQSASRAKTGSFGGVETVAGQAAALAMSDDDTAMLAWSEPTGLKYALRPLGGGFGSIRTVPGSTAVSSPRVTFAADGSARAL